MASWAGFSDEELRRIQLKDQGVSTPGHGCGRKQPTTNRSRQQLQRERALKLAAPVTEGSEMLPPDQKLSRPHPTSPSPLATVAKAPVNSRMDEPVTVRAGAAEPVMAKEDAVNNHVPGPSTEVTPMAKELDKQEVELREKTRLEKLQLEQRMMEEKNKQKKALLAKTIAEKSKQTQAEAVKLKRIQKELQALDDSVSSDINILRKLIEQASQDYSTAWKRFERAEAEYVAAKLSLHRQTEVKEQLTEHLCTIIQQNELRKASKLEELMQQLELSEELERQLQPSETPPADAHSPQGPAPPTGDGSSTSPTTVTVTTTSTTTTTTVPAGEADGKQECPEANPGTVTQSPPQAPVGTETGEVLQTAQTPQNTQGSVALP